MATTANANKTLKDRRILIVDDELAIRRALKERFTEEGSRPDTAEDAQTARTRLRTDEYDLMLLDHRLPDGTGLALLEELSTNERRPEVVMMTAYASTQDAVRAMKLGAADYVMKPFDLDEMVLAAERALDHRELRGEVSRLRAQNRAAFTVDQLVGSSRQMAELRTLIPRIAASGARTILVTGESGTGKDLVARAIHFASPEADKPFLNITCTALQETLLESELFGHERGAFTDAKTAKIGLFEQANGGTIFLDEIGDMSLGLQAKLLRFLESKQFRRVGGLKDITVDVRIIAATNKNLERAIQDGAFRSDLYYRLNVIPVEISPLRERPEDVVDLVRFFERRYAEELKKSIAGFEGDALELLRRHPWPGNVRELKNVVERAVLLSSGPALTISDLPISVRGGAGATHKPGRLLDLPTAGLVVDDVVRDLLDQALERTQGNKSHAARLLGIHRDQVRYWVHKYGLERWIRTREGKGDTADVDAVESGEKEPD
ncbi:MAG: sigma-54-dependent Fis family transcriptional regulator [Planctomycetes bacterium]|nr:sigma-54-dependent Fis family transcriptional regulator [Planctomycetota bacterium]